MSAPVATTDRRTGARRPTGKPAPSLVRTRTGRMLVLTLATVTMVVEMGSLLASVSVDIGSFTLSASAVPSLLLLVFLGARSVGEARDRDRLVPFWIAMVAGLGLGATLFARTGDLVDIGALLVAATNEEMVYRFAVPVVGATALMVLKVPPTAARVVGYLAAGTWWVLLPGHQEQVANAANLATYVAFAVISALVVARSRALVPMAVAHCVLNIITIAHARGDITAGSRSALSACLLFLLVGTFAWPGDLRRRAADAEDLVSDTVIDLRDGQPPAVIRDGSVELLEPADPGSVVHADGLAPEAGLDGPLPEEPADDADQQRHDDVLDVADH